MDYSVVIKAVGKLFMQFFSIKFRVFGYTVSVASCFVWMGLFSIVAWFVRRLDL